MNQKILTQINEDATAVAEQIKILGPLAWSAENEISFLDSWGKKNPRLPIVEYPKIDYGEHCKQLNALRAKLSGEHPMEVFTRDTIASYIAGAEMMQAVGTPEFMEHSIEIYGKPGDKMPGSSFTNVQAAERLVESANSFCHPYSVEPALCVSAQQVAEYLEAESKPKLGTYGPVMQIEDNLSAKATATSKTIRLRNATCFSVYDSKQLFEHEVMIHALTAINGREQPILKLLGCGAPRTTATQEGLATFAEVITGAIDLRRLKRLALRIVAIDRALRGANFLETFEFFLENSDSPKESFWSAARIFRGGFPDKNIVFTKDSVYLDGLIHIHTLFRWALINQRLPLLHMLFCGRLTILDCFQLEESYNEGLVQTPKFVPEWYERIDGLAGVLSFSLLANMIQLSEIEDFYLSGCRTA